MDEKSDLQPQRLEMQSAHGTDTCGAFELKYEQSYNVITVVITLTFPYIT